MPLDEKEVFGIAKSITKWTYSKFTKESFDDYAARTHSHRIQSIRGKISKGGGRPINKNSENYIKPWDSLGISRRKYYLLKASKNN